VAQNVKTSAMSATNTIAIAMSHSFLTTRTEPSLSRSERVRSRAITRSVTRRVNGGDKGVRC
jgi:hypothetical protein